MTFPNDPYLQVWLGVVGLLVSATIAGFLYDRWLPSRETRNTLLRIRTWWLISAALFWAMSAGLAGIGVLVAFLGLYSCWEISAMGRASAAGWPLLVLPAALFVLNGLVHLGMLADLESALHRHFPWLFFLILLTSLNDVAQYLWGKSLGGPRIVPALSPNKTWAGFLGGIATSAFLAALLAPRMTPFPLMKGVAAGIMIGVGGFAGDLAVSALKRRAGLLASGSLLPGHGGILDRIDSLCLTAPMFYWFTRSNVLS